MTKPPVPSADAAPVKISPEDLAVCDSYIMNKGNIEAVSKDLGIPQNEIVDSMNTPLAKQYLDTMFNSHGYLNRFKFAELIDTLIERKLEEYEEAEIAPDIKLDTLLNLALKHREIELRHAPKNMPEQQTNIQQNFYGDNYTSFMKQLLGDE